MSIIITETTRVCVQGITGTGGTAHTRAMLDNGTRIVAGVAPGHGGETVHGVPVFETCHEAVRATGATLSVSFVGRRHASNAVLEAADAGLRYVVCMEEFVPLLDVLKMRAYCANVGCTLIGPNTNGLIAPGRAAIGFFPREFARPGPVGIVSRSGTLTYGVMQALARAGTGVSTAVGIGGGAARGLDFVGCLELFAADAETAAVVLIGEIGGQAGTRCCQLPEAIRQVPAGIRADRRTQRSARRRDGSCRRGRPGNGRDMASESLRSCCRRRNRRA